MDKGVLITYKNMKREFFISSNTKALIINNLIRKAFHITSDIKYLRHPRGYHIGIGQVFQLQHGRYFEVITDDDTSQQEVSEKCSQKNMTRSSGRKFPPSEKELLDSKFFLQDFQLFMSEVTSKKSVKHFGIIFFSNKRKAQFLGKKILRQLIFQFEDIQFFYTLHPIKLHSTSSLLGQMLLFTIFKGNKMLMERQFPQSLSVIEDISAYLHAIISNGQISFAQKKPQQATKPKNLIEVQQRNRSFEQKIQSPRIKDEQQLDNKLELFRFQSLTPSKMKSSNDKNLSPVQQIKIQSPMKSHLTNQISFQNQFYQPSWFFQGEALNRIQKSFLNALIKNNDTNLINFCTGIDLKNQKREQLNIKLLKVFLKEIIDQKMQPLKEDAKIFIETNQNNRQSPVFSLLLKLNKFGNITSFVEEVKKVADKAMEKNLHKVSYLEIVNEIQKHLGLFAIRLKGPQDSPTMKSPNTQKRLHGKSQQLHYRNAQIAEYFHKSFPQILKPNQKKFSLPAQFTAAQKAMISDRILKNDPFLIESYIPSRWTQKKMKKFGPALVRQYLRSTDSRYSILEEVVLDQTSRLKLNKLQSFRSLLYYLYKQRIITRKQQKSFFYLYVWNDLNTLAAFEVYMFDRNLDQLIDSIYAIDFTYYLQQRYGIQMNQVENFSLEVELQLVFMMLFGEYIKSLESKVAIQKFIRAGDNTLLKIVKQNHQDREQVIRRVIVFGQQKRASLTELSAKQIDEQSRMKQVKKDRKIFIEQIIPVHFKTFKNKQIAWDCIDRNEPILSSIFQVYEQSNDLVEWIESFQMYIPQLQNIHMGLTLKWLAQDQGLDYQKVLTCRTDVIKGIYELYRITKDEIDTKQSLRKAVEKMPYQTN